MIPRDSTRTLTTVPRTEEPAEESLSQRKRPESGRYLLQVDRQTKGSYASAEVAEKAAQAIKKGHPVVRVAIYDTVDGVSTLIENV